MCEKGNCGMYVKRVEPIYTEKREAGNPYRAQYREGILSLIEERKAEAYKARERFGRTLLERSQEGRRELKRILGWPLSEPARPPLGRREEILLKDESCIVSRVHLEVLPGLWFYGDLMRHNTEEKLPLVISQHGGGGTPEVCSSFYDSTNYNDMSMRIFHKDVNVFAPQLLLWHEGPFGEESGRMEIENDLRRVGGSVAALEIYGIGRFLDFFEDAPWFNGRFGMIGLSYGGFYTLYTAACDERIRAALACSLFSERKACFGTDHSWKDVYGFFGDAEVGALVYPRALRIEWGRGDDSQWVSGAQEEADRLARYYANRKEQLTILAFDGGHEFSPEDDGIDWVLRKLNEER